MNYILQENIWKKIDPEKVLLILRRGFVSCFSCIVIVIVIVIAISAMFIL